MTTIWNSAWNAYMALAGSIVVVWLAALARYACRALRARHRYHRHMRRLLGNPARRRTWEQFGR